MPFLGYPVGGGVHKLYGGRGADLLREAERDSTVPVLWVIFGGRFVVGPSSYPSCTRDRNRVGRGAASVKSVQGLLPVDG